MRKHKGFTLVELLIVIGIIALLMAIMVPALNRAKEHAKNMVCQSNLKQYGLAGRMYLDDNDGAFASPHLFLQADRNDSTGDLDMQAVSIGACQWCDEANWLQLQKDNEMGFMWPYFKNVKLHLCPTFKGYAKARGVQATGCTDGDNPQYSYGQNMFLGLDGWDYDNEERGIPVSELKWGNKTTALKEHQVLHPANIFYFSEENMWTIPGRNDTVLVDTALLIRPTAAGSDAFASYHFCPSGDVVQWKGSANMVFVDAHVGSMSAAEATEIIDMVGHPQVPAACKVAWPRGEADGGAL